MLIDIIKKKQEKRNCKNRQKHLQLKENVEKKNIIF